MKRCPKCASSFPDTVNFCEFDGARLTADYLYNNPDLAVTNEQIPQTGSSSREFQPDADSFDSNPELQILADDESSQTGTGAAVESGVYQVPRDPRAGPRRQDAKLFTIVAVAVVAAVVAVGVLLFFAVQRMMLPSDPNSNESSNVALTQPQVPLLPSRPSTFENASPSPEPSPSASPTASPRAQAESARLALSSSPVSTGGKETTRRGPVTIRLTDGTSVEAEEVWETREGIWYRHRSVVTLLERNHVKAIERPSPIPSASPSISPTPSNTR